MVVQRWSKFMLKPHSRHLECGFCVTPTGPVTCNAILEQEIAKLLKPIEAVRTEHPNIVVRFKKYADSSLRAGIIGENRQGSGFR